MKAPFAFGSSSALLSLRFFISFFFPCLRRENSPLFAFREMCCAMRMSVFYLMRCEDTNGRMRLFLYRCERILCGYYGRFRRCGGVLRTPTTRRRTRDFGPKRKDLFGTVCVQMSPATKNVTKSRILTSSFLFFSKKQQNTNLQTWVACTAKEKGCPNRPSLSNDRRRSGAKPPRMKSKT